MGNQWVVEVTGLESVLATDFKQGAIVDDQGHRLLTEETMARLNGLKIQVFSDEHPPPHFRVEYAGDSANFTIRDCQKLNGGLNKWERNIRKWHKEHKADLIEAWNRLRPADCPVGVYAEDE